MMRTALPVLFLAACQPPPMTAVEQREAVSLSVETARMDAATDEVVHVTTSFTLGGAAADAVEELRAFWESQAPCATVTAAAPTLTVDFGTSEGCTWNGRSWTGRLVVTVERTAPGEAQVTHAWEGLSNGIGTLDGGATVTWSAAEGTREVVVDATWVGVEHTLDVQSDRTMRRLVPGGGPGTGIVVDGLRTWTVDGSRTWEMDIAGVELRPQDPAPQAGVYTLTNPAGRVLTVTFERVDEDTIRVTAVGRRTWIWEVTAAGATETSGAS